MRCKYCGAILERDAVGLYCPTRNCQWHHGADEADKAAEAAKEKTDAMTPDERKICVANLRALAPESEMPSVLLLAADEIERLRALLRRWVVDADTGKLDGVDLQLMVESEKAAEAAKEKP